MHLSFGKPFECDVCDFQSSSFGGLTVHRKSHGIKWQNGSEFCAICSTSLLTNPMYIMEHLAGHTNCYLFECLACDFRLVIEIFINFVQICCFTSCNVHFDFFANRTNSFDLIHNHGIDYHATYEIKNFAKLINVDDILKKIKTLLIYNSNGVNSSIMRKRTKPTLTETENAIAGILNESYYNFDTQITDKPLDDCEYDFSVTNPHSYNNTYDYNPMADVILNSTENNSSFKKDNFKKTELVEDKKKELISKNLVLHTSLNKDCGNSQVFDCPTSDPISIAIASAISPPVFEATEGILTVDSVTGQLFLEGLSLIDEKGNNIHIAIEDLASLMR